MVYEKEIECRLVVKISRSKVKESGRECEKTVMKPYLVCGDIKISLGFIVDQLVLRAVYGYREEAVINYKCEEGD